MAGREGVKVGVGIAALMLFLVGVRLVPSLAEEPKKPAKKEQGLVVLATGESLGNLEPCNCVEGMLGGFPRRLAVIRRERRRNPRVLVVDNGDLTGKAFHPKLLEAKTAAALELLEESGVTAVAVGERDLRLGVERLNALGRERNVTWLGANIRTKGGKRPFAGHRVVEVGGRKVVVIGILSPNLGDPTGTLRIGDPVAAVKAEVIATRAGEPLRVVLFHGSAADAKRITGLGGIDLVLCGHDQQKVQPLRANGPVHLAETLRDARMLTRVELLPDGPQLTHLRLDGHIPDDPWARRRVDRYYEEVRGLPEPKRKKVPSGGEVVGSETCMDCHYEAYEIFVKTKHYQAQPRIIKKDPKRANLQECIGCHVVGYGYKTGYVDMKKTPHLGEVGCESCHGVGGNHVEQGGGRGYGLLAGFPNSWKAKCVTCHDATNSPKFDFAKYMEKIKHWK